MHKEGLASTAAFARGRLLGVVVCALLILLEGCAGLTAPNATLESARSDFERAQADESVFLLAGGELDAAGQALGEADGAWRRHAATGTVDRLAGQVTRTVALARATAARRTAELHRLGHPADTGR